MAANGDPVLVIEDNRDLLDGLMAVFELEGLPVVSATDGRAALELLRNGLRPCIIIMDLMMPGMNGFEFRKEQRRDAELARIPVIACSGVTDPAQTAASLDAKALVQKPAAPETLIALVRTHCLKASAQR
jgi:two-component system chemotaxis response regulator CheY